VQTLSERLARLLDLGTGLQRVKSDARDNREFVRRPNELELVEVDEANWLERLRHAIEHGYEPQSPQVADIPKGKGAVRPAALLNLEDRVVYASLVSAMLSTVVEALRWSQSHIDFGYRLINPKKHDWFASQFRGWDDFRRSSLGAISEEIEFVVVTDITGFYENIAIQRLVSDLNQLAINPEIVGLVSKCLNKWALVDGRGIPQGLSASDVLAKVYLNSCDHQMVDAGFRIQRYVDDIRIFCPSI
jgi:hypothetical protein